MRVMAAMQNSGAMTAKMALIIYAKDDPQGLGYKAGEAVVTQHPITGGEIGAGFLLDQTAYADLLRSIDGEAQARGISPASVLYAGGDRMMWHCPSRRDLIWFRTGRKDFDSAMNGKAVRWPALLFLAKPGNLSVWALATDERPESSTPLYLAPFFNLYETGALCEGNTPLPKAMRVPDIPTWEEAFYGTNFTHSNYGIHRFTEHPEGHDGLWRERAAAKPHKLFSPSHLTPAKDRTGRPMTIQGALNL